MSLPAGIPAYLSAYSSSKVYEVRLYFTDIHFDWQLYVAEFVLDAMFVRTARIPRTFRYMAFIDFTMSRLP